MRETLTRSLSGIIYIALLSVATYSSHFTFLLLFAAFLGICIQEFCDLVRLRKTLPVLAGLGIFLAFTQFAELELPNYLLLAVSLATSVKCLLFLFDHRRQKHGIVSKYVYLIGYKLQAVIQVNLV